MPNPRPYVMQSPGVAVNYDINARVPSLYTKLHDYFNQGLKRHATPGRWGALLKGMAVSGASAGSGFPTQMQRDTIRQMTALDSSKLVSPEQAARFNETVAGVVAFGAQALAYSNPATAATWSLHDLMANHDNLQNPNLTAGQRLGYQGQMVLDTVPFARFAKRFLPAAKGITALERITKPGLTKRLVDAASGPGNVVTDLASNQATLPTIVPEASNVYATQDALNAGAPARMEWGNKFKPEQLAELNPNRGGTQPDIGTLLKGWAAKGKRFMSNNAVPLSIAAGGLGLYGLHKALQRRKQEREKTAGLVGAGCMVGAVTLGYAIRKMLEARKLRETEPGAKEKTAQAEPTLGDLLAAVNKDSSLGTEDKLSIIAILQSIGKPNSTPAKQVAYGAVGATIAALIARYFGGGMFSTILSGALGYGAGRAVAGPTGPYKGYRYI